jgi:hypothetical protein
MSFFISIGLAAIVSFGLALPWANEGQAIPAIKITAIETNINLLIPLPSLILELDHYLLSQVQSPDFLLHPLHTPFFMGLPHFSHGLHPQV